MKNVLLIGDSIRVGYDKSVRKTLEGRANVYFPEENTRFAAFVLRHLHEYFDLAEEGQVDVLHWNAGLWDCLHLFGEDCQTPLDVYAYYIERICVRIKKLLPQAHVIFATSTSVRSDQMPWDFKRYNAEVEAYNKAAVEVVKKYGFQVNDLYAVSAALPDEARSDDVHFYTPLGTEAFTNQVLSYIVPALGIQEELKYKEALYTDKPFGI